MTAQLLQFPAARPERSCWNCVHHVSGPDASVCMQFNEVIVSETAAAEDCPSYEEF